MKKILALVLSLIMLCCCAYAEEEIKSYVFDPAMVENLEGGFVAFEELGLQMFIPADVVSLEISEEDVAQGALLVMGDEAGTMGMSIRLAGVADADGNLITDLYSLRDFYTANGVEGCEVALFNDLPAMYYVLEANGVPYGNLAMYTADGYVLVFSIVTNGDELPQAIATVMLSSVMAYTAE